jgi:aminomethyltransferase
MSAEKLLETSLSGWHVAHGGRMVEFAGWSMPVQYTSIVDEHRAVRSRAGLFDISHMGRLEFQGPDVLDWLEYVTTNHVARLQPGQIQYSLVPNERGGLIDDILVYCHVDGRYAVVCNASNRVNVLEQLHAHRGGRNAAVTDVTETTAMIAVQGPASLALLEGVCDDLTLEDIGYYRCAESRHVRGTDRNTAVLVSRTGYTGEDGFELVVPASSAVAVWTALLEGGRPSGAVPCGLGARDTLRFEAAMPLYGHELGPDITPYEAGVGWAVKLGKGDFVGKSALEAARSRPRRLRVGLALEGKRIARQGALVSRPGGESAGTVTSGTFSPSLQRSLAMALVEPDCASVGTPLEVDIRGRLEPAHVVPIPFYRRAWA